MTRTATSETHQRKRAAEKTLESAESRKRAAVSAKEREMLDGIIDRARRSLAAVTAELSREDLRQDFVAKAFATREDE